MAKSHLLTSNDSEKKRIVFLLKGYPRLSETFIAQEIRALEVLGLTITITSLRQPTDKKRHPIHHAIKAPLMYLPEYVINSPLRCWRAWRQVRKFSTYPKTLQCFYQDFKRDKSINRLRRLAQAFVLAAELPSDTAKIHSHFIHTPTSVARYASYLTDIPFSMSAHAKDIWTIPSWEVADKLRDGLWLSTCTDFNRKHLQTLAQDSGIATNKVHLDYHGINLSVFTHDNHQQKTNNQVQLISVGRAVAKKGYARLLTALSTIDSKADWHFTHIGGGELLETLQKQAIELGISDKISWLGSQSQEQIIAKLRQSDVFILLSEIIENGDRDGLPNVIMEAQSQAIPVIATKISGIPEIIQHQVNGLLVDSKQLDSVTSAISLLIDNRELRHQLGEQGKDIVNEKFNHLETIKPLYERHIRDLKLHTLP